jgi:hypothetical protein
MRIVRRSQKRWREVICSVSWVTRGCSFGRSRSDRIEQWRQPPTGQLDDQEQAMARKVGARGLRMILEELMLDLMYHLPSQKKVKEFEVTREMVEKRSVTLAMMEKAG